MKKYRFLILCLAAAVLIAAGAVQKRTHLANIREKPIYLYEITYTVEVTDLEDYKVDALKQGTALYLEDSTIMGTVETVETAPAGSGAEDCYDLTLVVSGIGGKMENSDALEYDLRENNLLTFVTRYLTFEGTVTHVREADV
ncbi:MAG: hypothetical protein PUC06_12040 [Oscillospiraceae bacterium]|nr:hypothetical protein [Oscillospiraceae bacterium]